MTRAEYEKALELIRDNRDNVIEIAIGLNKMVKDDGGKSEKPAEKPSKAVTEAKKEDTGKTKPKYKPKKCSVCAETFQPKNNRQMKCDKCKNMTVEQDTKNTAAELAAMM